MNLSEKIELLNSLCHESKLCLKRKQKRNGRGSDYTYRPRPQLLARIAKEQSCTLEQARDKLLELRAFILKYPQYYRG